MPYPAMSVAAAHALICAPGGPLEMETTTVLGRPNVRVFKNAPPNIRALWESSKQWGDKDYIVYAEMGKPDQRITYNEGHRITGLVGHALLDGFQGKAKVAKGDRVAICMRNLPEWAHVFWATVSVGAIAACINAWLTGPEMTYCIELAECKIVFVDEERAVRLQPHLEALRAAGMEHFVLCHSSRRDIPGTILFDDYVKAAEQKHGRDPGLPTLAWEVGPDEDATIFFTTPDVALQGTTGKPKGALGTHRNFITNILNLGAAGARAFLRRGEAPPAPDPALPRKAQLLSVPLFHATGCHSVLQGAVAAGNKLVIMHKWDAGEALRLIEQERITSAGGVPMMAYQMALHPDAMKRDLSSLESMGYGGAPCPPAAVEAINRVFARATPTASQGYGLTETSSASTANGGEDYAAKPDSVGPPCPTVDVKVVDDDGNDLGINKIGELWIKGPNIIKGYYRNQEATDKAITKDGWLKSGDVGKIDAEGFVYILDRAKDMLIRGGENIYCTEVEDAMYTHPALMDVAVVGIPDDLLGELVGAVCQVKPEYKGKVTLANVQEHLKPKLAAFKIPIFIKFVDEPLPRNANQKILKRELRDVVAAEARKVIPKAKL
ncbi:AMP-dependent synthetase and ligase [Hyaloraphidium curvatum]|nr:AMP-dependent synthetase and ligase [Hyaloraphidium curvatum]